MVETRTVPKKASILASLVFLTLRWVKQKTSKGLAKGIALSRTAFNKKSPVAEHARSALDNIYIYIYIYINAPAIFTYVNISIYINAYRYA